MLIKKRKSIVIIISLLGIILLGTGMYLAFVKTTNNYSKKDIINNNVNDTVYIKEYVHINNESILNNDYYIDQKNNIYFTKYDNSLNTVSFYEEKVYYAFKDNKYEKSNIIHKPFYLMVYDLLEKENSYNIGINNIDNLNLNDFNNIVDKYMYVAFFLNHNKIGKIDKIEQVSIKINDSKKIEEIDIVCVSGAQKISFNLKVSLSSEKVDQSLFSNIGE